MYLARLILVSIFVVVIVVTFGLFTNEERSQAWKDVRPTVLGLMDSMYATIRNFVAGSEPEDGVEDNAPGVDFDIIITLDRGKFLST